MSNYLVRPGYKDPLFVLILKFSCSLACYQKHKGKRLSNCIEFLLTGLPRIVVHSWKESLK